MPHALAAVRGWHVQRDARRAAVPSVRGAPTRARRARPLRAPPQCSPTARPTVRHCIGRATEAMAGTASQAGRHDHDADASTPCLMLPAVAAACQLGTAFAYRSMRIAVRLSDDAHAISTG